MQTDYRKCASAWRSYAPKNSWRAALLPPILGLGACASGQVAPNNGDITTGAFSGLFRMPTPSLVPEGCMSFDFSGGAVVRLAKDQSYISTNSANYSAIMGFLPSMEIGASFLTPSFFNGQFDDRAIAVKYVPFTQERNGFGFALGATDVQGTLRRGSDYFVASKMFGSLSLYGGASRGLYDGFMAGASIPVFRGSSLCVEAVGGTPMVGMKAKLLSRMSAALGVDKSGGAFYGIGYSIPLASPLPSDSEATVSPHVLDSPVTHLASLVHGESSWTEQGGTLAVVYDDVEVRDPIQTFGRVLGFCASQAGSDTKALVVRVRRFGTTIVSFSGKLEDVRDFLARRITPSEFGDKVEIVDGVDDVQVPSDGARKSGRSPSILITLQPQIGYRLGLKDDLPNKEWTTATAVATLPNHLLAVISQDIYAASNLDSTAATPAPGFALYHPDLLAPGLWGVFGVDQESGSNWAAALRLNYSNPDLPFQISAGARREFDLSSSGASTGYYGQASIDALRGTLSVWARKERFLAGDVGESVGVTRRLGQTWVTLSALQTSYPKGTIYSGLTLRKVGVDFQFPLPRWAEDFGSVRVMTADSAHFAYQPTVHVAPPLGLGVVDTPLFSPEGLTGRTQLTAMQLKERLGEIQLAKKR